LDICQSRDYDVIQTYLLNGIDMENVVEREWNPWVIADVEISSD
jgi:hypothetical protein